MSFRLPMHHIREPTGDLFMHIRLAAITALLALAACDAPKAAAPAATEPPVADAPEAPDPAAATPSAKSCGDIAALAAAMAEPEPFASLRTGKVKLGDRELDENFTTAAAPAGATCTMGRTDGFVPDSGPLYVVNCTVFSSGMLDREETAVQAKAAFDAARNDLTRCLPKGWTSRDGSKLEPDSTEAMIFESAEDAKRAMDASFYAYPVELKKEWSEGDRGAGPGWRVTLNFQKDTPKAAAQ